MTELFYKKIIRESTNFECNFKHILVIDVLWHFVMIFVQFYATISHWRTALVNLY